MHVCWNVTCLRKYHLMVSRYSNLSHAGQYDKQCVESNMCLFAVQAITSTVPIKDHFFATVKSTNYLPNALVVREAEEKGASVGIWLDEEGNIAEGQNMNVGFVTTDGELLLPPFDRILSGCTARRVLELAPKLVTENAVPGPTIFSSRAGTFSLVLL